MKPESKTGAPTIIPRRIRSYLTLNLSLAVLMAVVMAVRTELNTGHFLLVDYLLFSFYTLMLAAFLCGPASVVESYLYRQKKGVWYAWENRTRNRRLDRARNDEERRYWKNEAVRTRLFRGDEPQDDGARRTGLFAAGIAADAVSRPALLLAVADRFERAGKREAAQRCYLQITEQFANSPQAAELARRLKTEPGPGDSRTDCQSVPR